MTKSPLLQAENLSYSAPGGRGLGKNLQFTLNNGEMLLITGPNGSGKSTLLNLFLDTAVPHSGRLTNHVERRRIAIVPQLQNMEFHLPLTLWDVLQISKSEPLSEENVLKYELLSAPQLGLLWNTASGGERQKTLMTRALLQEPELLILDEPFNHLDDETHEYILKSVEHFLEEGKAPRRGAILVSHGHLQELQASTIPTVHLELKGQGK